MVEGLFQDVAIGMGVLQVLVAVYQTVNEVDQLMNVQALSIIFES